MTTTEVSAELTHGQLLFWAGQKIAPENPMYNAAHTFVFDQPLDIDRFRRAFQCLIDRCDTLRSIFIETESGVRRQVLQSLTYDMPVLDFSEEADPQQALDAWVQSRLAHSFELDKPLFDAALIRLDPNRYVWYLCQHHIICDAWSTALVFRKTGELYSALASSETDSIACPPYEAFVEFERANRHSERGIQADRYWRDKLALPVEPLTFYGRLGNPLPVQVQRLTIDLGAERSTRLRTLAKDPRLFHKNENVTLANIFVSTLLAYLHRVSGNKRIRIGMPYHNRVTASFKETPGLFIEVLPLQMDLDSRDRFVDLVHRVRDEMAENLRQRPYFVQNRLDEPCYSVSMNFQIASFVRFDGMRARQEYLHPGYGNERLVMHVHDFDQTGHFLMHWDIDAELFDESLRDRALAHFLRLLDGFVETPEQNIGAVDLLTDSERYLLLHDWNPPANPLSVHDTVIHRIARRAAAAPDAPALVLDDQIVTYAELNRRADDIARALIGRGAARDSIVALLAGRSIGAIVGVLGIMKAGAAYLPLDPMYPVERLTYMLEDSGAALLLCAGEQHPCLAEFSGTVLKIEDVARESCESSMPLPELRAEQLAYAIYTSGSTGKPKAALIEHGALLNLVDSQIAAFEIDGQSRVLQFASLSFDASVSEIFTALASGATLVLARPETLASPAELYALIRKHGITVATLPPALLRHIASEDVAPLRTLVSAGERCPVEIAEQWRHRLRFINGYGPTETTVCSSLHVCDRAYDDRVPIGRPLPNTRSYVLNECLQMAPIGVDGELYVGGAGVARGYLNRPQLNEQVFLPDPFSNIPGARMYKTGDRVRWNDRGELEYLDRADNQVKLRGHRVELGEVEASLSEHPAVELGVAAVREDSPGGARLVAYVALRESHRAAEWKSTRAAIRDHLAARLPDFMMPSALVCVDSFPLSPNGKVDRTALPAPDAEAAFESAAPVAPRTALERQLADIWAGVLGHAGVGVLDSFFDLGGHSLLAIDLMVKVRQAFGVDIPLPRFMVEPTVAAMAEFIDQQQSADPRAGAPNSAVLAKRFTLVPVQTKGSRPPFFFVSTGGGVVFPYFRLAPLLGHEQPLYALQDPYLNGDREPFTKTEDLAAHYVEVMREFLPNGPYLFGGYSYGGFVAYEMARMLKADGVDPALVVVIDCSARMPGTAYGPGLWNKIRVIPSHIAHALRILPHMRHYVADGIVIIARHARHLHGGISLFEYLEWVWVDVILKGGGVANVLTKESFGAMKVPTFRRVIRNLKYNKIALMQYKPKPYAGTITLFRAMVQASVDRDDMLLGWDELVPEIDLHHIPGDHLEALGNSAEHTAGALKECIDAVVRAQSA